MPKFGDRQIHFTDPRLPAVFAAAITLIGAALGRAVARDYMPLSPSAIIDRCLAAVARLAQRLKVVPIVRASLFLGYDVVGFHCCHHFTQPIVILKWIDA